MRRYHVPPFASLPPADGTAFRWVGSTLMDEEQYRMERWEGVMIGPHWYWRASRDGCLTYADTRRQRRDERRVAWAARQEAEDEWSEHIAGMVEP